MRDTANWWAGLLVCVYSWSPAAGSSRRVWHGLAIYSSRYHVGVDTRPSLWLLVPSRYTERGKPARGKPVLISILAFSLVFHAVTLECNSFRENHTYFSTYTWRWIPGIVCGAIHGSWSEMLGNRQTDTHDNYCNPRCASASRVKRPHSYAPSCHVLKFVYLQFEGVLMNCYDCISLSWHYGKCWGLIRPCWNVDLEKYCWMKVNEVCNF